MTLRFSSYISLLLLSVLFFYVEPTGAVKIVRLQLEYGSDTVIASGGYDIPKTNKTVDLELYDDLKPITVANYLDYVSSDAYDLTFVNRSIPGFVLQSGGVTNISVPIDEPIGPTTFSEVVAFSPNLINEPGLPNIRGSIAMAKLPDQPDSATSEWFINLKDNSDPLNTTNGGFTVFGSVIDDGMETADQISAFPIANAGIFFGPEFTDLPIADADPNPDPNAGPVADFTQINLVMILTVTEISRPILRFSPAIADFGFDVPGVVVGKVVDVIIRNTGDEALDIVTITPADIRAPFSIQSETCSGITLDPLADPFAATPVSSCTVTLEFQPTTTGLFSDNLVINYISKAAGGDSYSVKYPVLGEGALGVPQIAAVDKLDITSQVDGFSSSKDIIISNNGKASLQITSITDLNSTDFSQSNDCIGNNILIAPGQSCSITVSYTTSDFGEKVATLTIDSNDPVNSSIDILLTGFGDSDADGVASVIEDSAPNEGDNDVNDIADSLQNNVASFLTQTGEYISLVVDSSYVVTNISTISAGELVDLPTDVEFKNGVHEYEVIVDAPGKIIDIGLILPSGVTPDAYYLYGETADNAAPHWYKYEILNIFANSTIEASTGEQFVRNFIKISVQDGGPGDSDNTVDGKVTIGPAAAAYSVDSENSTGGLSVLFISVLYLFHFLSRRLFSSAIV